MASYNRVTLVGNLTRDPELRYTPSGKAVAKFAIALNETKTKTTFLNVAAWDATAENVATYLRKGAPVLIDGRICVNIYEGTDGSKRTNYEISAYGVQFLGKKPEGNEVDIPQEYDEQTL